MRGFPTPLFAAALLATAGCDEGGAPPPAGKYMNQDVAYFAKSAAPAPAAPAATPAAFDDGARGMMGGDRKAAEPPPADGSDQAAVSRKVIYNATLDLAVDDLDAAGTKVGDLVASSGGYIAEETMTGSPGTTRSLFWKLRIPIDGFDGFVKSVRALGELVQFNRTSQDVTAEFYDVEARIKNKRVQEQTLQKMLEERSGVLEDVLKVETELSRVRGEIEQMEGRIRVLRNLTSLATLTLTLRERERFQPPAPVVADFPTQIARTWGESTSRLVDVGKSLVLFVVAEAPWLPFYAIGLLIVWAIGRRLVGVTLVRARSTPPANPSAGG